MHHRPNVKHRATKPPENKIREKLDDLDCDDDFLDTTIAQVMNEKNQQGGLHWNENFWPMRDTVKWKDKTNSQNVFAKYVSDKGLVSETHKEILKVNNLKIKKRARESEQKPHWRR